MQFAICNEIFQEWKLADAFAFIATTGYDAVEIAPFTIAKSVADIPPARRREIRDSAAQCKLGISGIHWVLAQTEGLHLSHPDDAIRAKTSRYLCDLVDFCADLGGRTMVFGSPKQRNVLDGVTFDQAWQQAAITFRDAVKRAEDRGVTICFEPLAPTETNFINTAAEAVRFVRRFASPAMKIILDVKAMCSEVKPIPQIVCESRGEFAYFHANDRNLKGPGFGDVDFKPIAAALKEVDYDGFVSVEVFDFDEGAKAIATKSLSYLKSIFKQTLEPV